jgi:hypothetical protein
MAFVALRDVKLGVVSFCIVESTIYNDASFDAIVGLLRVVAEDNDEVVFRCVLGSAAEWCDLHYVEVASFVFFFEFLDLVVEGVGLCVGAVDVGFVNVVYDDSVLGLV